MWLSAEKYAELKAAAVRAELAESRLQASEVERDTERKRHYEHSLQLTNQLILACGRWPVKDEPKPSVPTEAKPPIEVSEEAKELFIEDFAEVGLDRDEAVAAFDRYKLTGEMPYEREVAN